MVSSLHMNLRCLQVSQSFIGIPIVCIVLGILIMILTKLNIIETDGNWGALEIMKSFYSELYDKEK